MGLRISYIGVKGIPARWGGMEVYVEEVAKRLVERGHDVSVYSRRWYSGDEERHLGIKIITTPTIPLRFTDAILHGFFSSVHACFTDADIVHYHGLGSYFFSFLPRIFGKKVVGTIHSADWTNPKWGAFARALIRAGLWFALKFPDRLTVAARYLKEQLKSQKSDIVYTPGGIEASECREPDLMLRYGLKHRNYVLFIGRFEEQKRIDWVIRAHKECGRTDLKLAIAGGGSHCEGQEYEARLRRLAGDGGDVVFTGYVGGPLKEELLCNALLMVLPSAVEGLPISLLEALAYGVDCLVSDIAANREFIEEGLVHYFSGGYEDFLDRFKRSVGEASVEDARKEGERRRYVVRNYAWDGTVDRLETLYKGLAAESRHGQA